MGFGWSASTSSAKFKDWKVSMRLVVVAIITILSSKFASSRLGAERLELEPLYPRSRCQYCVKRLACRPVYYDPPTHAPYAAVDRRIANIACSSSSCMRADGAAILSCWKMHSRTRLSTSTREISQAAGGLQGVRASLVESLQGTMLDGQNREALQATYALHAQQLRALTRRIAALA